MSKDDIFLYAWSVIACVVWVFIVALVIDNLVK